MNYKNNEATVLQNWEVAIADNISTGKQSVGEMYSAIRTFSANNTKCYESNVCVSLNC